MTDLMRIYSMSIWDRYTINFQVVIYSYKAAPHYKSRKAKVAWCQIGIPTAVSPEFMVLEGRMLGYIQEFTFLY